jgi:hypothetical protein
VFEYLQEVQVKTVGIPAEFGGALGGVISAVTKSGSNTFRGETHYYYLGSGLSAGPVKRLVLSPVDEQTVSYVQDPKPADHRQEIGGSLGGPIVRGQLYFFGSMSPRFRHRNYDYKFDNGLEPGRLENTQAIVNGYGKVSYSHSRQHVCRRLVDADLLDGTDRPTLRRSFSRARSPATTEPTRGFTVDQRNVTVSDINLTTSTPSG